MVEASGFWSGCSHWQSFGRALPAFVSEYRKAPSGVGFGLQEPQRVTNVDVLCICFWAWKLETEFLPVGLVYFLQLGTEGGLPLCFSVGIRMTD